MKSRLTLSLLDKMYFIRSIIKKKYFKGLHVLRIKYKLFLNYGQHFTIP